MVGEGAQRRGADVVLWRAILSTGEGEREGNEVATLLTSRRSSGCAWLARKGGGEGDRWRGGGAPSTAAALRARERESEGEERGRGKHAG